MTGSFLQVFSLITSCLFEKYVLAPRKYPVDCEEKTVLFRYIKKLLRLISAAAKIN
jgi:hypothetical protein